MTMKSKTRSVLGFRVVVEARAQGSAMEQWLRSIRSTKVMKREMLAAPAPTPHVLARWDESAKWHSHALDILLHNHNQTIYYWDLLVTNSLLNNNRLGSPNKRAYQLSGFLFAKHIKYKLFFKGSVLLKQNVRLQFSDNNSFISHYSTLRSI